MFTDKAEHTIRVKKKKIRIILGVVLALVIYYSYKIFSPFFIIPSEIKELNEHIRGSDSICTVVGGKLPTVIY